MNVYYLSTRAICRNAMLTAIVTLSASESVFFTLSHTKMTLLCKADNYHYSIVYSFVDFLHHNYWQRATIDKEPDSIGTKLCLKCKNSLEIKRFFLYQLYCWPMADGVGFEPTCRYYRQTDFESAPLWPLRYPSVLYYWLNTIS